MYMCVYLHFSDYLCMYVVRTCYLLYIYIHAGIVQSRVLDSA